MTDCCTVCRDSLFMASLAKPVNQERPCAVRLLLLTSGSRG